MKKIQNFNGLISDAAHYLESQLLLSTGTIDVYRRHWRRLRKYMYLYNIDTFEQDIYNKLLIHYYGARHMDELTKGELSFFKALRVIQEFHETNCITKQIQVRHRTRRELYGPLGELILQYLLYQQNEARLSYSYMSNQKCYLHIFFQYCEANNVTSIKDIDLIFLLQFIKKPNSHKRNQTEWLLQSLRCFYKYLYTHHYIDNDIASKLPKYKRIVQPKLPSVYSSQEIETLLSSIKRNTSLGKRDYAIILMLVRLGLRASDLANLKFENLCWGTSTIELEQCKTGKHIQFPLLPDLGNAIIDYLRHGRPVSDEPYVFLKAVPPFERFTNGHAISHIAQHNFQRSGINIGNRRYGSHALRHSLSSRLLEGNTVLPVISEVLGHKNSDSTRYYLRIDIKSMQNCMLDVPAIPSTFYNQKGGTFYEVL